jgi:autotransporter-associated beta strand protein
MSHSAVFNFGGGTLQANNTFATTLPLTLTGKGGSANVNTSGYDVTFLGQLSGEGGLSKHGAGVLMLAPPTANAYLGRTAIFGGTLQAKSTGALPGYNTADSVAINNGGTLAVNAGGSGEWTADSIQTVLSQASFSDGSAFGIDTTDATGGNFDYGNSIGGNFGLTKLGTGNLTLTGAITYTGTTTINEGTLRIITPMATQANIVLHDIVGMGELVVGDGVNGTYLTADSICVATLRIGAGPGATQSVPEPETIVLLVTFLAVGVFWIRAWENR